jgi:hypothetical protein
MRQDPTAVETRPPTAPSDPAGQPARGGHPEAEGSEATRARSWLVRFAGGEQRIEADEVEITVAGVLAFYRSASRAALEKRTLLMAFSPGLCWRCQLERER